MMEDTKMTFKRFRKIFIQVDVIIAIGGFCCLLLDPLRNEYIYMKVAEMHNTTNKVVKDCRNHTNMSRVDQLVASEVSRWTLLFSMSMFLPASIAGMLVTSWGDRVGRKVAMSIPITGMILGNLFLSLSVYFKWHLRSLYLYYVMSGMGGYYMVLLMQGNAYLGDVTAPGSRGIRFVILETSVGVFGGVAGLVSGFWVEAEGFFAPVVTSVGLSFLSLLLLPLLPDSTAIREEWRKEEGIVNGEPPEVFDDGRDFDDVMKERSRTFSTVSLSSRRESYIAGNSSDKSKKYTPLDLMRAVWSVYSTEYSHCEKCHGVFNNNEEKENRCLFEERCIHGGGRYQGRVWRMWFYLASYDLYMFVNIGTMALQTIYFLSYPLCFTPVLVGIQVGVRFLALALSPVVVYIYQKCLRLSNNTIIICGLTGFAGFNLVLAFATKTYIVFLGTAFQLFSNQGKPFIQAQMSNLVSEAEQGAAFALLSCTETITFLIATVSFLTLYPATVGIYHGFSWLFGAGVTLIPICLVSIIYVCDRRRQISLDGEREPLLK